MPREQTKPFIRVRLGPPRTKRALFYIPNPFRRLENILFSIMFILVLIFIIVLLIKSKSVNKDNNNIEDNNSTSRVKSR